MICIYDTAENNAGQGLAPALQRHIVSENMLLPIYVIIINEKVLK